MPYINYKKISYILSELPGLSGKMAFEFLYQIINSNDMLKITFHGQGEHSKSIDSLLQMYNDTIVLINKSNEKAFIITNLNMDNNLLEILCSLGKFPNFLKISKIDSNLKNSQINYHWSIEYCDEFLIFTYLDDYFDDSKITLIEKTIRNKGIHYERKEEKKLRIRSK